jgi:glycosyltransferase involved in cell wall biosynthesis
VDLPAFDSSSRFDGRYAAYVGRISREKGLDVLLEAARQTGLPVRIAGDPAGHPSSVERAPGNVRFVGRLDRAGIAGLLAGARFLVTPSIWWEVFGLVAAEAMSREVPVIATSMGGLPEVVEHLRTGLLVPPNDAGALAGAMRRLWSLAPADRAAMGRAGREIVQRRFSPDVFYGNLMRAYARVSPAARPHHARSHAA